jgi:toxin YoeB
LIEDILRNGYTGIGHPEPLKGNLSSYWSREIDEKNRIVYRLLDNGNAEIIKCKGHYYDK